VVKKGAAQSPGVISVLQPPVQPPYQPAPAIRKFEQQRGFEFPAGYGDNKIIALVRDPYWIYVYWEVNLHKVDEIRSKIGNELFSKAYPALRVFDVSSWHYFDLEVGGANNWYIRVPTPNRSYCVEIGFKTPDGRFFAAARSNIVTTPLDRMSDVIDEEWMIVDWEKIYGLSGGFGLGKGSEAVREMMRKRLLEESASGWVSSGSPVKKLGERPFWLVANAELIVYGATEPTAKLTIQGRQVPLKNDGTFSLRYALPDGRQTIPIEAIRDDGQERRQIKLQVERQTE
jgi:hypothetical protein